MLSNRLRRTLIPVEEPEPSASTPDDVLAEVELYVDWMRGSRDSNRLHHPKAQPTALTDGRRQFIIDMFITLMPPDILVDWHNAQLGLFEGVKEIAEAEPADEPLDQTKMFALIPAFQALEAARIELPQDGPRDSCGSRLHSAMNSRCPRCLPE